MKGCITGAPLAVTAAAEMCVHTADVCFPAQSANPTQNLRHLRWVYALPSYLEG